MKSVLNFLRRCSAVIVGVVFFTSGVLKLMDPVGTGLIVAEWLKFFHLGFLGGLAKFIGVVLAIVEGVTGAALITGVYRSLTGRLATALTGFFTIVTLILWIGNPQMDCGCFGEALHLTHFQSFAKNVVLLGLCLAAFVPFSGGQPARFRKKAAFWVVTASLAGLCIYSLVRIPLVDFTPFNTSSRLAAAEGSVQDEYVAGFVYEKGGQRGVFTLDRLPDSTWTYVETIDMKKQDHIAETSFPVLSITDAEGNYRDSLAAGDMVMTVSVYAPAKVGRKMMASAVRMLSKADSLGFTPLMLIAGTADDLEDAIVRTGLGADESDFLRRNTFFADYKTLISLNRSNGGAVYFNAGNLIKKWSARSYPADRKLARYCRNEATELAISASADGRVAFQAFFLYSFIVLFLL